MKPPRISPDHRRLLAIAVKAVRAGERAALVHFDDGRSISLRFKKYREIVTRGDAAANAAIIAVLKKLTPLIPVCSEEGGDTSEKELARADLVWVLDPIDGSSMYAAQLPLWGISLALVVCGEPVIGVISLPNLKQIYTAIRGGGAWMGSRRIRLGRPRKLSEAIVFLGFGHEPKYKQSGRRITNALILRTGHVIFPGAAVVTSAWTARGISGVTVLDGVRPWDVAAGALLVREAGGKAVTFCGTEWTMKDPDIILAPKSLVLAVMSILRKK